ncbi:hypothetical protein [Paenibacillus luteus]|uniref:hypothetical protein n=1 Tax=Paenibacillus luteus TaxID=2545753 RepID=UPI0011445FDF|nr:hypothetical protein [Paenibacillus luteus]
MTYDDGSFLINQLVGAAALRANKISLALMCMHAMLQRKMAGNDNMRDTGRGSTRLFKGHYILPEWRQDRTRYYPPHSQRQEARACQI